MKTSTRWLGTLLAVATAGWWVGAGLRAAEGEDAAAEAAMAEYLAQQREAEEARAKDPAWKPACDEVALIQVGDATKAGALRNFCVDTAGNILACVAPPPAEPGEKEPARPARGVQVFSPDGKLLRTLPLEITPGAISVAGDGTLFVAGSGKLLKLDPAGKVLASAASPVMGEKVTLGKEMEEMIKEMVENRQGEAKELRKQMQESLEQRRADVTGLAVTGQDVFMVVPAPNDFTYRVYRFDHALKDPKLVVEKLRGCCGQMDLQARDGKLWIPHNARHQVESRDRDGKQLAKFGKAGRVKPQDFGGCCEPKNLRVLANGEILAAESGPPTCIKRFSAAGKFLGVVAVMQSKGDCVRVTVDVSPDGTRFYLLDTARDAIRVFSAKG